MAVAAAGIAVAPSAAVLFKWSHTGSPDYTDPADTVGLGSDPLVHLEGVDHPLYTATSFAGWVDTPPVVAGSASTGKSIPQSVLDAWCAVGGRSTPYLRAHRNLLILSAIPEKAQELFESLVSCGGLDLSLTYTEDSWYKALSISSEECQTDPRTLLDVNFFYSCESRPVSGSGSAAADNWMYGFGGDVLLCNDDGDTFALAQLMAATSPRNLKADRDVNTSNYRRVMNAIKRVAVSRDDYFKSALEDGSTPSDEIVEYLADTWSKLVKSGYPFRFEARASQRCMELGRAAMMAFGTDAQKEATFKELLPGRLVSSPKIAKCIVSLHGAQHAAETLEAFEQLVEMWFPGSRWYSFSMMGAVEFELSAVENIIDTWGNITIPERMQILRAQVKQDRDLLRSSKSGDGPDSNAAGLSSSSGILATRSQVFLDTKQAVSDLVAGRCNFTMVLDLLNKSLSKVWRAVALRKLNRCVTGDEIESCSKYVNEWPKYWTICLATDLSGNVNSDAQGRSQSERNSASLLAGNWGKDSGGTVWINWIEVAQSMDLFCYKIKPSSSAALHKYATLVLVKDAVFKTMKMLKLARHGESGVFTVSNFFDRIISLERRSRALPKGSNAREVAKEEYVDALLTGLQEFGQRWAKQFAKPVNFNEPMITEFSDQDCFIMNTLDKLEDKADKYHQFSDVIFSGHANNAGRSPHKRTVSDSDDGSGNEGVLPVYDHISCISLPVVQLCLTADIIGNVV